MILIKSKKSINLGRQQMSEWNLHSTKGKLNSKKKEHFGINWHLGTPASEIRQFWLDLQVEFWSQGLRDNLITTVKSQAVDYLG